MKKIDALEPESAHKILQEKEIDSLKIDKISLEPLQSLQNWRKKLKLSFSRLQSKYLIDENATKSFLDSVNAEHAVFKIEGESDILIYHWNNKEPKIVPIWGNMIIQSDLYWLQFLPFLEAVENKSLDFITNKSYNLKLKYFKSTQKLEQAQIENNLLISQNNHFGHFLLDHLPLIALLGGPLGTNKKKLYKAINYPYKKSITELAEIALAESANIINASQPETKEQNVCDNQNISSIIRSAKLIDMQSTNQYTNAYLWSQLSRKLHSTNTPHLANSSIRGTKIMLIRGGNYKSRIENWKEVKNYLKDNDFIFIDPSKNTAIELLDLLKNAKIVICESGSTTLNAAIFANISARIVSLNSKRLFQQTDSSMIHGGLPYLLAFCDRIEFILGEAITESNIQSSDITRYSIFDIKRLVER